MTTPRELRCYQYVNRPFERVKEIFTTDPAALFQRATSVAAARAGELVAKLKLDVGGFEIDRDVRIEITSVDSSGHPPAAPVLPATVLALNWKAASGAAFFPVMRAEITAYPLSADETQLDLHGWYEPPGGVVGAAADRVLGHRIAEACVHRFLDEVVQRLVIDAG